MPLGKALGDKRGGSSDPGGGVLSRAKRRACTKSSSVVGDAASQTPCTYSCVS